MKKIFPVNVFRDVKPQDFNKFNKKEVTEDFVAENFKLIGWYVYKPFVDTGIDLIIVKKVCPDGHTKWNENTRDISYCNKCRKELISITRYIQIKTRELKETQNEELFFGYTLRSKDFRTDPRHVFLLYSDFSLDFLIFSVYDYLKLFQEHEEAGITHFANNSFRVGNNKMNNIKYDPENNKWFLAYNRRKVDLSNFVNEKGIGKISNPNIDFNIHELIEETAKIKCDLFYKFNYRKEKTESKEEHEITIYYINQKIKDLRDCNDKNIEEIIALRQKNRETFCEKADESIVESVNKYWQQFNIEIKCEDT